MQTTQQGRGAAWGGGPALLAATGMLTALLATGADAARHHAVRHHGGRTVRHHARHYARHYARMASSGGDSAYGEGVEHALAGVRIDDSFRSVLQRFGNPSETQLEEIELVPVTGAPGTTGSVGEGSAGAAAVQTTPVKIFVGPSSPEPGAAGGTSGNSPGAGSGLSGALSGALGALGNGSLFQAVGGFPGSGSSAGAGGAGAGGSLIKPEHPEYRWIYDEPNSNSLEFTFSPDGKVIQIRATGYHGFVRTNRGIALGVKFSQVLLAYGNPEKQNYDGPILSANYTDRSHVGFQFYNQRLVGITVAAVE